MIDSFEKQLEAKKFEMASDRVKFCLDYLKERGYFVVKEKNEKPEMKNPFTSFDQNSITTYRAHLDDNLIAARFTVSKQELDHVKNVSYIKQYVEESLAQGIASEVVKKFTKDIVREEDCFRNCCTYTLQLRIRSNK